MSKTKLIIEELVNRGYSFFSGVPCSYFKRFLEGIFQEGRIEYIPASREDMAIGIASGAYLAGRKGCILIQNSGLGHIVNSITSFNLIYKIPVLIFVSWRGCKGKDAPEHEVMGRKTISILKSLGIPYRIMKAGGESDLKWAFTVIERDSVPVVLIVKKGFFA